MDENNTVVPKPTHAHCISCGRLVPVAECYGPIAGYHYEPQLLKDLGYVGKVEIWPHYVCADCAEGR